MGRQDAERGIVHRVARRVRTAAVAAEHRLGRVGPVGARDNAQRAAAAHDTALAAVHALAARLETAGLAMERRRA